MKICKRCGREFHEDEIGYTTPAKEFADIFLEQFGTNDAGALCPECREEIGMVNLMSFGQ